jgi:hypothetical protein
LNTNGKIEMTKAVFKSEMTANDAKVIPIAKDPVLPTKIFPRKLKNASKNQKINGTYNRIAFDSETRMDVNISPTMTIPGQIVSKPFNPPSIFTVLVTMVTIRGIIMI